jgi:hypothetical protein
MPSIVLTALVALVEIDDLDDVTDFTENGVAYCSRMVYSIGMTQNVFALVPDGREFPVVEVAVVERRTEVRRGREVEVVVARAGNKFFRHAVDDDLFPGDVLFATRAEAEAASAQRQAEAAEARRQREQYLASLSNQELCAHMGGARNGWSGD